MTENGEAPSDSGFPGRKTGAGRDARGRWIGGNSGARRHGLRVGTRHEFQKRDERTTRLLGKYLNYRAAAGREVTATQVPLARRYVELTIMAQDLYAAWSRSPTNTKLHERYISTTRALALLAGQLGESESARSRPRSVDPINGNGLASQLARWRLTADEDQRA